VIRIRDLTKRFGDFLAVDGINLEVRPGELFGFLGPNGAGKTTTIKMMAGVLKPTRGSIIIDGKDIQEDSSGAKQIIGFIPDRPFLYEKLTGVEFLTFISGCYGVERSVSEKRIFNLFRTFELEPWGDELIEAYSYGMRQRLIMAAALIHDPKVLIVDEPLMGLDPKGARLVKEIFRELCGKGTSIFMSTHILQIAEELCDRLSIIHQGKIIATGIPQELQRQADSGDSRLESIFLKLTGGEDVRSLIDSLRV
jgi:ABC-2 type transport system ATP-binding protein